MLRTLSGIAVCLVASLALVACGGDGGGTPETTTRISVTGTDGLAFQPSSFAVPAGQEVTVELTSGPGVEHDFIIEDAPGGEIDVVHADAGQTSTGRFTIDEPGTYTVFCSVPGHRQAGMEATLTVVSE